MGIYSAVPRMSGNKRQDKKEGRNETYNLMDIWTEGNM